jgi:hypothetical protein
MERHFAFDKYLDPKTNTHLRAGDVWKMTKWNAFSDLVLLGFSADGYVKVSRPYLYASGVGTVCPTSLLGCETFDFPVSQLVEHYTVVESTASRTI